MAQSLGHLAAVMSLRGDSSEALRLHRESLAMLRRVHGASADVPAVAASLSTVAEALHAKHQLAESVRLHREALAMERRLHADEAALEATT